MIYRAFFKLVLQRLDPERAHLLAARAMRTLARIPGYLALSDWLLRPREEGLHVRVGGIVFRSPLGVAAGMDKDATWFQPLTALGFGAVEVGTVTAQPQPGNPRPRVSRLPRDHALLNAMGFPNDGSDVIAARLAGPNRRGVIGVNIGKTKVVDLDHAVADYRESARRLAPFADYLALNVSSPNTPGLRQMQTVERLTDLVTGVREELRSCGYPDLPLMIKLGPDLSDDGIGQIADMAMDLKLAGIIAVNTTVDMSVAAHSAAEIKNLRHSGGISGRPLKIRGLEVLRVLYARTQGRMPLISVGGIETAEDAWTRILAGATLLQAHTAFVYEGPMWARRMNSGLARCLRESQWSSIEEAVGGSQRRLEETAPPAASTESVRGDHAIPMAGRP